VDQDKAVTPQGPSRPRARVRNRQSINPKVFAMEPLKWLDRHGKMGLLAGASAKSRRAYLAKLRQYCAGKGVELICYCLLPNHVHLLVETPQGNLSKLMQAFQTSYTLYFNRRHGRTGHLFEQRYKAFLVDRDSYLLQVSRYIHLNPVAAKLVARPEAYRWSSYAAYVREAGGEGLKRERVLGQWTGAQVHRMAQYRAFVEGALAGGIQWARLPITHQAFIGDEEFVDEARRRAKRQPGPLAGPHGLREIVRSVGAVVGLPPEQLQTPSRNAQIQRGRELLMYVARRQSGASLREIAAWLGLRDLSTISHGVRRATVLMVTKSGFRRQVAQVVRRLAHSRIHAFSEKRRQPPK
jgi:REP element-mobilizing transposase RayT